MLYSFCSSDTKINCFILAEKEALSVNIDIY